MPKRPAFAENWGYERVETDWRKLVEAPDIDLIDIGVPNNTHKEIAIAAARPARWCSARSRLAMNVAEPRRW
jgi:predicted dehydrogenase